MRVTRWMFAILVTALIAAGVGTTNAFHDGGVAECVGCHTMHDAKTDTLLIQSDPSSTCLSCHENATGGSYHVSTVESAMPAGVPPKNMSPGGDFGWLKKDYTWNPGWAPQNEAGERHGHNIVAVDFFYDADTTNTTDPPGGAAVMNPGELACTSCHDQHGQLRRLNDGSIVRTGAPIVGSGSYNNSHVPGVGEAVGVYRLLRGRTSDNLDGSDPGTGDVVFSNPVPAAVAPSSYNRAEDMTDTRVAYGAGMSKFCATCHPDMHTDGGLFVHTVDANMGSTIADTYDDYVGSGDLSGDNSTSYDSLIPFQTDNSTDYVALAALAVSDGSVTTGPVGNDRVNCLSCHRAHASGWEYATRWDNEIELIIVDGEWPGTNAVSTEAQSAKFAKGRTVEERAAAYNNTSASDYATYQRVLCNKCHAKD